MIPTSFLEKPSENVEEALGSRSDTLRRFRMSYLIVFCFMGLPRVRTENSVVTVTPIIFEGKFIFGKNF